MAEEKQQVGSNSTQPQEQVTSEQETKKNGKKSYAQFNPGPITRKTPLPGVFMDFNYGVRISFPEGNYRVRFTDLDTASILYDAPVSNMMVSSIKKYYINFRIDIFQDGKLAYTHFFDPKGKKVHIKFPVGTLGDIFAWFPYARFFKQKHQCEVYCSMAPELGKIFTKSYPDLHFIGPDDTVPDCYATYYMGIFFPADDRHHQPVDWRIVGLQKTIAYVLGLEPHEVHPDILPVDTKRIIKEPYVCIAVQSSSMAKHWCNPSGWLDVVDYLKKKGYRVLCIDKEKFHGTGAHGNAIPFGAEDFTGSKPLQERIDLINHADFFVGLSSGLSWVAWGVNAPVVMISGFTLPINEFYTPYRVINYHVCNSCWNDSTCEFVHSDFMWCPRHANTNRQFECTRFISSGQVIQTIDRLMKDYGFDPKTGRTRDVLEKSKGGKA